MREVTLDQFVRESGQLVDWVRQRHDGIVITFNGRAVARLEPATERRETIEDLRAEWGPSGQLVDVISPIEAEWEAQK